MKKIASILVIGFLLSAPSAFAFTQNSCGWYFSSNEVNIIYINGNGFGVAEGFNFLPLVDTLQSNCDTRGYQVLGWIYSSDSSGAEIHFGNGSIENVIGKVWRYYKYPDTPSIVDITDRTKFYIMSTVGRDTLIAGLSSGVTTTMESMLKVVAIALAIPLTFWAIFEIMGLFPKEEKKRKHIVKPQLSGKTIVLGD